MAWAAHGGAVGRSARSVRTQVQTSIITSYHGLVGTVLTLHMMTGLGVIMMMLGVLMMMLFATLQRMLGLKFKRQSSLHTMDSSISSSRFT